MSYVLVFWLGAIVGFFAAALLAAAARDTPSVPHEWFMSECLNCGASQSGNRAALACTPRESQ